jgi:hypothetical protein
VSGVMPGSFRAAPGADDWVMAKLPPEQRAQMTVNPTLRADLERPPAPQEEHGWEALRAWLAAAGGETLTEHGPGGSLERWSAHPADVVLAMAEAQEADFLGGDVRTEAVRLVFGGERAEHCDNGFLVETLVPHAPLPVRPGFVLYADRD